MALAVGYRAAWGKKGREKKSDEWHNYVALFLEEGIWGVCLRENTLKVNRHCKQLLPSKDDSMSF